MSQAFLDHDSINTRNLACHTRQRQRLSSYCISKLFCISPHLFSCSKQILPCFFALCSKLNYYAGVKFHRCRDEPHIGLVSSCDAIHPSFIHEWGAAILLHGMFDIFKFEEHLCVKSRVSNSSYISALHFQLQEPFFLCISNEALNGKLKRRIRQLSNYTVADQLHNWMWMI